MANDNNQPKPPNAPISQADLMATMTKLVEGMGANFSKAIQDAMVMASMAADQQKQTVERAKAELANLGAKCPKCAQRMKVCGGPEYKLPDGTLTMDGTKKDAVMVTGEDKNHMLIAVIPSDMRYAKFFQGMWINNRKYRSKRPGHKILVPRKNDIATMLAAFDKSEDEIRHGRDRSWDSGIVTGAGDRSGFRPAEGYWRQ